jgi:hypothetical protein
MFVYVPFAFRILAIEKENKFHVYSKNSNNRKLNSPVTECEESSPPVQRPANGHDTQEVPANSYPHNLFPYDLP